MFGFDYWVVGLFFGIFVGGVFCLRCAKLGFCAAFLERWYSIRHICSVCIDDFKLKFYVLGCFRACRLCSYFLVFLGLGAFRL